MTESGQNLSDYPAEHSSVFYSMHWQFWRINIQEENSAMNLDVHETKIFAEESLEMCEE